MSIIDKLGRFIVQWLNIFIDFFTYIYLVFKELIKFKRQTNISKQVLLRQILFTGYEALSLTLIMGLALGFITIFVLGKQLSDFGQDNLMYSILIYAIVREASCLLTAFIVAARSGSAIATELGIMNTHKEIDFLKSIGISPISYLIIPRMLGVISASILLPVYFNFAAIWGGWFLASLLKTFPYSEFSYNFFRALSVTDFLIVFIKSLLFGIMIALLSCYHGLKAEKSLTEIPQRTILSIVSTLSVIFLVNIIVDVIVL